MKCLWRKGLISKVAESFQERNGDGSTSLMDGFYHSAFTPDGSGGIYHGGRRTWLSTLSRNVEVQAEGTDRSLMGFHMWS